MYSPITPEIKEVFNELNQEYSLLVCFTKTYLQLSDFNSYHVKRANILSTKKKVTDKLKKEVDKYTSPYRYMIENCPISSVECNLKCIQ